MLVCVQVSVPLDPAVQPQLSSLQSAMQRLADAGQTDAPEGQRLLNEYYMATGQAKVAAVIDFILDLPGVQAAAGGEEEQLPRSTGAAAVGSSGKLLVFAYHQEVLNALQSKLCEAHGIGYVRIDGSTSAQQRQPLVDQFQSDPSVRLGLLSVRAAGAGLTLTAADRVVFAELHWNPTDLAQCEDRIHRVGQARHCSVYYCMAANSCDSLMWGIIVRKLKVVGATVDGAVGPSSAQGMSGMDSWQRQLSQEQGLAEGGTAAAAAAPAAARTDAAAAAAASSADAAGVPAIEHHPSGNSSQQQQSGDGAHRQSAAAGSAGVASPAAVVEVASAAKSSSRRRSLLAAFMGEPEEASTGDVAKPPAVVAPALSQLSQPAGSVGGSAPGSLDLERAAYSTDAAPEAGAAGPASIHSNTPSIETMSAAAAAAVVPEQQCGSQAAAAMNTAADTAADSQAARDPATQGSQSTIAAGPGAAAEQQQVIDLLGEQQDGEEPARASQEAGHPTKKQRQA